MAHEQGGGVRSADRDVLGWCLRQLSEAADGPRRATLLRQAVALFMLVLVAVTNRLWTPQALLPQVPLFHGLANAPVALQWCALAVMLAGLAGVLVAPARGRTALIYSLLFIAGALVLVGFDQLRFQPWLYLAMLLALPLALAPNAATLRLLRLLVISLYFHSALSKFDYSFLDTLGVSFLDTLITPLGFSADALEGPARLTISTIFPLGELLVAIALFFHRTRAVGMAAVVLLHVVLLWILGPRGLDHKPGVLVWNLFFIVQAVLLFGRMKWLVRWCNADEHFLPAANSVTPWATRALVGVAVVLPFFTFAGWIDIWPAWGLYATSAERVELLVHRDAAGYLPAELQAFLQRPADPRDPWLQLRLDRWCLETLGAPIYPQNRVQLGIARAVTERFHLGRQASLARNTAADRLSGKRSFDLLAGEAQLDQADRNYFFNTRPAGGFLRGLPVGN